MQEGHWAPSSRARRHRGSEAREAQASERRQATGRVHAAPHRPHLCGMVVQQSRAPPPQLLAPTPLCTRAHSGHVGPALQGEEGAASEESCRTLMDTAPDVRSVAGSAGVCCGQPRRRRQRRRLLLAQAAGGWRRARGTAPPRT